MPLTRSLGFFRARNRALRLAIMLYGTVITAEGCGGDSPPAGMQDDSDDDDDDDDNADASTQTYRAKVVESTNVNVTISGVTVVVLDRATGAELMTVVSGSQGEVELAVDGDEIGMLARAKPPLYTDTYSYGPLTSGLVRVGTVSAAVAVPMTIGYQPEDDATPVAGNVVWVDPKTRKEEYVGCAEVSGEGASEISYFVGALPTALRNRASTQPDRGNNELEAGKYFVGNLSAPGMRTLTASVRGEVIGSVTFPTFARKSSSPQELGGKQGRANLTLVSVYADTPENPTPSDCE